MDSDFLFRITTAIERFEKKEYSVQDFHATIESIIPSLTESSLSRVGIFFQEKENDLERIDFLVNEENRRDEYIKIIQQIKHLIATDLTKD